MIISSKIRKILNDRGYVSEEEIAEFLSDKPKLTYDAALLNDVEEGAELILSEIANGSKILVYGDYDADGITSTTLMLEMLKKLGVSDSKLGYYIPSRFEEGYGLNMEALKGIAEEGFNLVITVDCGSVSRDEVEYAKELGLKVIVTDHHNIVDVKADCLLINPKRPDSNYPFKELSGCGVAFKLAQVLQRKANLPKTCLSDVLDLVAIGTIGDIMPLIDENRTLVKFGLRAINNTKRLGLVKLITEAGLNPGSITSENVSYVIVPHLNASGRMEDASLAVELLLAREENEELDELVEDLIYKNSERKRIQNEIYARCVGEIGAKQAIENFIILNLPNAHEGIVGIVAGKVKENYKRPVIIVTNVEGDDALLKGTSRSVEGVDIYAMLNKNRDLFLKFGGHKAACGFTIEKSKFNALCDNLYGEIDMMVGENPSIFNQVIKSDLDVEAYEIDLNFAEELELLAPFGKGNTRPKVSLKACTVSDVRTLGADGKHVGFSVQNSGASKSIRAVKFNVKEDVAKKLAEKTCVDVVATVQESTWQGQKRVQLLVDEIIF